MSRYGNDNGALLLQGLLGGAGTVDRAANTAIDLQQLQERQAAVARQLGQEAAARRLNLSAFDLTTGGAPDATIEAPVAGPPEGTEGPGVPATPEAPPLGFQGPAPTNMVQTQPPRPPQGFAPPDQGGTLRPLTPGPMVQGAPPTMAAPNPDYAAYMSSRADFSAAPSHAQLAYLEGTKDFYKVRRVLRIWDTQTEPAMRSHGFNEADIEHAKADTMYRMLGMSPQEAMMMASGGSGGLTQDYEDIGQNSDPQKQAAARAHLAMMGVKGEAARPLGKPEVVVPADVIAGVQKGDPDAISEYMRLAGKPPPKGLGLPSGQAPLDPEEAQKRIDSIEAAVGKDNLDGPRWAMMQELIRENRHLTATGLLAAVKKPGTMDKIVQQGLHAQWQSANSDLRSAESRLHSSLGKVSPTTLEKLQGSVDDARKRRDDALNEYMNFRPGTATGGGNNAPAPGTAESLSHAQQSIDSLSAVVHSDQQTDADAPATPDEIQAAKAAGARSPEEAVNWISQRRKQR